MSEAAVFRFESRSLRQLTAPERERLRLLTADDRQSHMRYILRERPEHVRCFLAWHAETIVGWSLARWFAPFRSSPRNAHISVFVDPQWRRHGLGRALVGQAVEFAKAYRLTPWVSAGAPQQLQFFRACEHRTNIVSTPFRTR